MNVFCPDGYVPIPNAVLAAAKVWFPLQIAASERVPLQVLDALLDNLNEAAHRLRNFLHQGELKAYYFENDDHHFVSRGFWAATDADEVMESGIWAFGEPSRGHGQRRLFLKESELDALLNEQPAKKRPLPELKVSELAAAMGKLSYLSRPQQREALRKSAEFRQHHITDRRFREAARQVPRGPGRKPLSPEQ